MSENEPVSEINIPLLRKAVEWVEWQEALPEKERTWHQSVWTWFKTKSGSLMSQHSRRHIARIVQSDDWQCQTVMCVAGYIAIQAGWRPTAQDGEMTKDGVEGWAEDIAAEELGLSKMHSSPIFYGGNSAADIRRYAEQLAGERL